MLYSEHVVLVDEQDNILGIEDKLKAQILHCIRDFLYFFSIAKKNF